MQGIVEHERGNKTSKEGKVCQPLKACSQRDDVTEEQLTLDFFVILTDMFFAKTYSYSVRLVKLMLAIEFLTTQPV